MRISDWSSDVCSSDLDVLVSGLAAAGWPIPSPPATMFCWAPLPPSLREMGSLEFSKLLLEEAQVAVAPGIGFGEYGEGFVRLGLVENEHRKIGRASCRERGCQYG